MILRGSWTRRAHRLAALHQRLGQVQKLAPAARGHATRRTARHPLGVLRHEEPRKIGAGHGRGERDAEGETTPPRAGGAVGLLAPVRRLMALRARPSPPFKLRARRAFALCAKREPPGCPDGARPPPSGALSHACFRSALRRKRHLPVVGAGGSTSASRVAVCVTNRAGAGLVPLQVRLRKRPSRTKR
jgi:hypothetical protein